MFYQLFIIINLHDIYAIMQNMCKQEFIKFAKRLNKSSKKKRFTMIDCNLFSNFFFLHKKKVNARNSNSFKMDRGRATIFFAIVSEWCHIDGRGNSNVGILFRGKLWAVQLLFFSLQSLGESVHRLTFFFHPVKLCKIKCHKF